MAYIILPSQWRRQPPFQCGVLPSIFGGRPVRVFNFWNAGTAVDLVSGYVSENGAGTGWAATSEGMTQKFSGSAVGTKIATSGLGSVVAGSSDIWIIARFFCPDNANTRRGILHDANSGGGSASFQLERYGGGVFRINVVGVYDEYFYPSSSTTAGWWTFVFQHSVGSAVKFGFNSETTKYSGAYGNRGTGSSLRVGSFGDYTDLFFNGNVSYVAIGTGSFNFDAAVTSLRANVWGDVFRPIQRRIYVGTAAAGGTSVNLAGLEATGAVGDLARAQSLALTGQAATGAVGTLALAQSIALTGLAGTGAVGAFSVAHAVQVSGLAATGAVGSLSLAHARALSGLEASGAVGSLVPSVGAGVVLSGLEATGAVGLFALSHSITIGGVEATGAVGALSPTAGSTVALTGVEATGAVGSLSLDIKVPLSGLEAAAAVGDLGISTPISVTLGGLEATGAVGSLAPGYYNIITHRPDEDLVAGAWLPSTGADLYATIDEAVTDDADYDYTESASTMRLGLPAMVDPGVNYAHRFTYRIKGDGSTTIYARVGAGSTAVAEYTHSPAPSVLTTYTQTLTSGEVIAFRAGGGYANGWIEFEAA